MSPRLCVSPYKDASRIRLRVHPLQCNLSLTNYLYKDPISKQGHILGRFWEGYEFGVGGDSIPTQDIHFTFTNKNFLTCVVETVNCPTLLILLIAECITPAF